MNKRKKHCVLVVEDELPLQKAIQIKLEKKGFEVYCVRGVQQAMEALNTDPKKEAIWLDHYLLGKGDGLDFVIQIKSENSLWKHIPIFVVSNSVSFDKVRSYIKLGVDKYFTKSEHPLVEIIDDLIDILDEKE